MRILVISPIPTHPTNAGNAVRVLNLMQAFEQLGHEPHLLHVPYVDGDSEAMEARFGDRFHRHQYQKPWRNYRWHGIPLPDRLSRRIVNRGWLTQTIDQFYDDSLNETIMALHSRYSFEAAIVEYAFFSAALETLPPTVRKLIDTHDIYTNRHVLLRRNGMEVDWFFTTQKEEAKGLVRADAIIAIQTAEERALSKIIDQAKPVITVGHFINPQRQAPTKQLKKILMVGSNNLINNKYFQQFIDECWAPFTRDHDDCQLLIAGGVCTELTASDQSCHLLGFVDDLPAIYAEADIVVNPLLVGTGLKIKSLEALSCGRALLAADAGLEGLEEAIGQGAIHAKDFSAMRQSLDTLYKGPSVLLPMSESAFQFAERYQAEQYAALESAITGNAAPELKGPTAKA